MSNKDVTRKFFEIYGKQHDVEGCTPYIAQAIQVHSTLNPTPMDFDTYRQTGYAYLAGFPDLDVEVVEELEDGNKVVSRVFWSGTHTGAFNGMPPTGRYNRYESIYIDTVENGQIVERHEVADVLSMLQQIGVIPMPQAA